VRERIEKSSGSVGSHISFEVGKPTFRVLTLPSAAQLSGKLFYSERRQSLLTRSRSLRRGCRMRRSEGMERRPEEESEERSSGRQGKKRPSWDRRAEENWKVKKLLPSPFADVLEFNRVLQDELYSLYFSFFLYRSIYPPIHSVFFLLLLSISRWLTFLFFFRGSLSLCSFTSHFIRHRHEHSSIRGSSLTTVCLSMWLQMKCNKMFSIFPDENYTRLVDVQLSDWLNEYDLQVRSIR